MKVFFFLVLLFFYSDLAKANNQPVNSLIGDAGYRMIKGHYPTESSSEFERVQYHLLFAEYLLRHKDVSHLSSLKKRKRKKILDYLHAYALAGKFPKNLAYKDERKPCFIDQEGTICAVGYLLQETEGRKEAELINAEYQYAEVMEMDLDIIGEWAEKNGLTVEECAIIQPAYNHGYFLARNKKVLFFLGPSYRPKSDIYSKFELSLYKSRLFKRNFPSLINLQLVPLRDNNYELALSYLKPFYFDKGFKAFAGLGGQYFKINGRDGWNLLPQAGLAYQRVKDRLVFNTQINYSYHIGLQNQADYTPGRNDISLLVGLGFTL